MATKTYTTDLKIRVATHEDVPAISAFLQSFVDEGKLLPRTLDELEELLPTFFIAENGAEIVGCAALEIYSRKLAEVRSLAVSPRVQGRGVGKLLVQTCIELAREKNVLEVMAITSSDDFFKSCGFDYTLPGEKRALFIQTREKI